MKKYVCSICGYAYNEDAGIPKEGIPPGTLWADIPEKWVCPLCGAAKSDFFEEKAPLASAVLPDFQEEEHEGQIRELSFGELSALFSNLSKGCEKQYLPEESELFNQLADYYKSKATPGKEEDFSDLIKRIEKELAENYPAANGLAEKASDRGSLRSLVWGEKVTRMMLSHLKRYEAEKDSYLANSNVYVCEICGFLYVGNDLPDICPVCKVPNIKIPQIERGN